ncbi:hypothetical protein JHD50_03225 [Sulfurimonas sp. MAG313]|nr:hypothetical protein [Sulfurimonas sp. MAG313]MDF1880324.1 hypothetical protein [Sulfurimonas sp. MAG313]
MLKLFILYTLFIVSLSAESALEYDYETDIYYSNASVYIDLDKENENIDASNLSEIEIYTRLLRHTFSPNIFLIEASIHPMSLAGLYFRSEHEGLYKDLSYKDFNLIRSVTAGFEEPYSLSFFIGRMLKFNRKNEEHIGSNRAFIGYLTSIGDYSIKDNKAYYDKWINLEFKLKGTRDQKGENLDWSFRFGSRIHDNRNFTNSIYIGARRSRIDFNHNYLSWLYNSAFAFSLSSNATTFELIEAELILEKKFPSLWDKSMSFGLEIGYLYTGPNRYLGELQEEGINRHVLILRPNIKF